MDYVEKEAGINTSDARHMSSIDNEEKILRIRDKISRAAEEYFYLCKDCMTSKGKGHDADKPKSKPAYILDDYDD